jgi:hypothetical protein
MKQDTTIRWGVYLLRNKAERVGSVEADSHSFATPGGEMRGFGSMIY